MPWRSQLLGYRQAQASTHICTCNHAQVVSAYQKISDTEGSFTADLDNADYVGKGLAYTTDLDSGMCHPLPPCVHGLMQMGSKTS